jgi:hypothetical protein
MQMRLLTPPVAGWQWSRRSLVVLRRFFSPPPFLFFVHRPCVHWRALPAADR